MEQRIADAVRTVQQEGVAVLELDQVVAWLNEEATTEELLQTYANVFGCGKSIFFSIKK